MVFKNSPLNNTSIDLERELIKRFRILVELIPPECRVFRELNGKETVLCLDFADCPQDLNIKEEEWSGMSMLIAVACDYLGLAKSVIWKKGQKIVAWITFEEIP